MKRRLLLATVAGVLAGVACSDRHVEEGVDAEKECLVFARYHDKCTSEPRTDVTESVKNCVAAFYWDDCAEEGIAWFACLDAMTCDEQALPVDQQPCQDEQLEHVKCWLPLKREDENADGG